MRPCLGLPGRPCGKPTRGTRCPSCKQAKDRGRNQQRTHYHGTWAKLSKDTRDAWVAEHGWLCPGYGRPPHPVPPGALELDHVTGHPLCHPCNVAAGPAGPDAAIPH